MIDEVESRQIPGYDGLYFITEDGEVSSLHGQYPRIMKHVLTAKYHYVKLSRNGKPHNKAVHRLVLETFVGPCPAGHEGAHLDGNPANNRRANLQWVTHKENSQHDVIHGKTQLGDKHWMRKRPTDRPIGEKHGRARFTNDEVRLIKSHYTGERGQCAQLARQYAVPYWTMRNIVTGHRWSQVTVGG